MARLNESNKRQWAAIKKGSGLTGGHEKVDFGLNYQLRFIWSPKSKCSSYIYIQSFDEYFAF